MGEGLVPKLRFPEFRDTPECPMQPLSTVAEFVAERVPLSALDLCSYISTETILPDFGGVGKAPALPTSGSFTRYAPGDVLIANIRPYLKKVWHADRAGGASNDVIVVRSKPTASPGYVACLLRSDRFIDYIMRGAKGVKMPRGDVALMKAYPVPVPSPAEQRKIAECLTSLDELIAAEGRKLEALRAFKKGLMQNLFPREGETTPRLRFPEFRTAGEWEETSIARTADVITGSTPSTARREYYGGAYQFVSPADITEERYVEQTKTTLSEEGFAVTRFVPAGSVLFVCIGSTIGKVAQNKEHCATNQQINAVVPGPDSFGDFLYYGLAQLSGAVAALAGRQAVPIVSKSLFSSIKIRCPGLPEQRRIASCLGSLDTLITEQAKKLNTLKTHKQGLMQGMFPAPPLTPESVRDKPGESKDAPSSSPVPSLGEGNGS
ncbi:MAG: restriction endonuclease subunit S [Fimbriimonadaceae bacterium]|nr:restriction endonuclease subunit S [Fimbriimonadaceae bacterium]